MTHSIRKQYLQIEVNGSESDALALQSRLSGWCQDLLFPALERALDRCVPNAEYWSLDRLEIDAGTVALECLEQDLPALIELALEKALRTQPLAGIYPVPLAASSGITQKSALQYIEEAWTHFLTTGTLPWGFRLPVGEKLEQTILKSWLENPSYRLSHATLNALQSANARKRLVKQFTEIFLIRLLERIAPDLEKMMAGLLQRLKSADLPADAARSFSACLWEAAFAAGFSKGPYTEAGIIRAAWQNLPVTMLRQSLLTDLLIQHWPEAEQTNLQPDSTEGIYIENAGLVLLHPFLPRFFEALNIAEENTLIQPERALCLLHFLTTGQRSAPEYELVLPKVLCNIPLSVRVESDVQLTDTETEEAMELLEAVIRHWDALKNTGIDGLRGTFLLRAGKITLLDDGDWRLQVESKAYDILLDQLPWGIGMIKLPWMQRMLWVEWS